MKRGESMRSRGYTLIEIAGVMVVLGLLLGASLWPLNRQLRESEYRQERAKMERLSDAVLGYALRHRTPGVGITMIDDTRGPPQTGFYAAGHPYLPCADVTGDGIEDRYDLISPVVQTLTLSFKEATPRRIVDGDELFNAFVLGVPSTLTVIRGFVGVPPFFSEGGGRSPIIYSGACSTSKGQLPWRTLGSIPADYWGNRYTYFADSVFSQEAIGFDEKTIADSGVRFLPRVIDLTLGYIPQKRNSNLRLGIDGRIVLGPPSVICDVAEAAGNPLDCGKNGTIAAPATLVAGESVPTDGKGFLKPEDIARGFPGDIADGLPFVIVSHGHNGFGAFNHLVLRQDPDERQGEVCRDFMDASAQERVNAYAHEFIPTSDLNNDVVGCRIGADLNFSPSFLNRGEGYFFAHRSDVSAARAASSFSDPPPPIPDRRGTDDLLVWMTRGDLARRMREADVFPLIVNDSDRPPVFYEPP